MPQAFTLPLTCAPHLSFPPPPQQVSNCPLLEHVYISGSERVYTRASEEDSNVLAVLGRNLAHLQVICVSHASKAGLAAPSLTLPPL
jgi:hypothetical protein